MDRREYKSKPFHLVTDPKTGEIKREVFPSDVDVGSQQIGANLKVYGTISGSISGSAITVRSASVDVSSSPFSTIDFLNGFTVDNVAGIAQVSTSGSICPKVTQVVANVAGNGSSGVAPTNWTGSYVSGGGPLIAFISAGGYTSSTNQILTMNFNVSAVSVAQSSALFNSSSVHGAFPSLIWNGQKTAGTYAVSVTLTGTGASGDTNDFAHVTILEYTK